MVSVYLNDENPIEITKDKLAYLFKNNQLVIANYADKTYYNYGKYYEYIEENYDLAKKYYILSADLENYNAMITLSFYYLNKEQSYEKSQEYLLMAINWTKNNDEKINDKFNHTIDKIIDETNEETNKIRNRRLKMCCIIT